MSVSKHKKKKKQNMYNGEMHFPALKTEVGEGGKMLVMTCI